MKRNHEASENSSRRDETSLYVLSKKFIKLLHGSSEHQLCISHAAGLLNVGKRRIYDITNVLEGLGMVSKWSVNNVKWARKGFDEVFSSNSDDNDDFIKKEVKKLSSESTQLDQEIEDLHAQIGELSTSRKNLENAYVTYGDIQRLNVFNDKLVFALKAPSDSTMECPRYEKGAHRLKIITDTGNISVYYVTGGK
ncbi:transcription factor E2F3 [Pancytospora epiphaga]|nr:transcription factor E2F3 [Pancytospora epiphaga]